MNFFEAFDNIKSSIIKFDSTKFDNDFAIQFTMTNKDCGGIFYIEYKDGQLNIEPYNYYDNNVEITAGYSDLCKALSGKLALSSPKLVVSGDAEGLSAFISAIEFTEPEKEKKAPAKKAAVKTTVKKAATTKKTAEKPAETKETEKKTASKKSVEKKTTAKKSTK